MKIMEMNDQKDFLAAATRWGAHSRTVRKWVEIGGEVGEPPPLYGDDPGDFLDWYRRQIGREPSKRLRERSEEMRREAGLLDLEEVEVDLGPIAMIGRALERLGLSLALARVLEEEERAHESYQAARQDGRNTDAARRRWREAQEMKRGIQKTDDAVEVAEELLKEWVRKEFEPGERAVRDRLAKLDGEGVDALLDCVDEEEMRRAFGEVVVRCLTGGE